MRFFKQIISCLVVCFMISPFDAHCAIESFTPPEAVVKSMEPIIKSGFTVKAYFQGPADLIGIAGLMPSKDLKNVPEKQLEVIYFMDARGRYLFAGMIVDLISRRNVVQEGILAYFPPKPSPLEALPAEDIFKLPWVEQRSADTGKGEYLYFFIDPDCPQCRREFFAIASALDSGRIKIVVRWIVTTLGSPSSTTKASLILGDANPLSMLTEIMSIKPTDTDRIKQIIGTDTDGTKKKLAIGSQQLEKNLTFMKQHQINALPLGLYLCDGKVKQILKGFFDVDSILQHVP